MKLPIVCLTLVSCFAGMAEEPRWIDVVRTDFESVNPLADSSVIFCNIAPRGWPVKDRAGDLAQQIRKHPTKKTGILVQSTMGHGMTAITEKLPPWQQTVEPKYDFKESTRFCPLDSDFLAYISRAVAKLAALKPDFFMVDDDTRLEKGCFCPLHLTAFSKRTGQEWTRETLVKALKNDTKLAEDWRVFNDETISGLITVIRREFAADIPGIFCTISRCEGARRQAKILAGPGHRPAVRIGSAPYWSDRLFDILSVRSLAARERAVIGDDVDLLQEADTCPHTRWRTSATRLCDFLTTLTFEGIRGAKMWITPHRVAERVSTPSYVAALERNKELIRYLARGVRQSGVKIVLGKQAHRSVGSQEDWGSIVLGRLGIPYRYGPYEKGDVVALGKTDVKTHSDRELREILSGKALLDTAAVQEIRARKLESLLKSKTVVNIGKKLEPYPQKWPQMGLLNLSSRTNILAEIRKMNDGRVPGGVAFAGDGSFLVGTAVGPEGESLVYLDNLDLDTVENVALEMDEMPASVDVLDNGRWRPVSVERCGKTVRLGIDCLTHRPQLVRLNGSAQSVCLECEAFSDWGGWVNDTQFMDQMGSPYLLAHGLGRPVADAKTSFEIKEPGEYNVFVRTMNWTARWSDKAAGTFRLIVDGTELSEELGTGPAEWHWRKAGAVTLSAGTHTLALHDMTGFDGRCDAICLTKGDVPMRMKSVAPPQQDSHDLVVVGGGIAGICTAVSAARLGLKVALVHDRPVLGGNNSSEVRVHLGAWQNMPPYPRLGDIVAEIGPSEGGNARSAANYEDERKLAVVKAEKNLDLFLNSHVDDVETNGAGRLVAVLSSDTRTGARHRFAAPLFVDCTGDGTVGFLAGAEWRMGREAKDETGESWAPEKRDTLTMGASVQWYAEKAEGDAAFPLRPWMIGFRDESCRAELRGDWDWEAGLGRDQIAEAEYIRDYGLLVAYSNWGFVKNSSARKGDFADKELKWVAYNAGRRESRRLVGDFVITERHIQNRQTELDGTCAATWTIDLHFPKKPSETTFDGEPFRADSLNEKTWPYAVPYRCLYSRNVPNLFMAGRDISVTHVALGTTRLMRTHGMMGEVVGMAASLCRRHGCDPRGVYLYHLDELKSLMEKGVGDGKAHPSQMYNLQTSLDPRFQDKEKGNFQVK